MSKTSATKFNHTSAADLADRFSAGSKSALIPEQVVPRDGAISVPHAGRIQVAGRRPQDVQALIETELAGKAIQQVGLLALLAHRQGDGDGESGKHHAILLETVRPFRKSIRSRLTSSGRSCCSQWPAPGRTMLPRRSVSQAACSVSCRRE